MRLRLILLVLSLLVFLSVSTGGYLYYYSLKEAAFKDAERQAGTRAEMIRKNISSFLSENIRPVKTLAGIKEISQALTELDEDSLTRANAVLDHFKNTLYADVCYLTDREGNTVASSNRDAPDSFVGKNFGFRPYFREAVQGAAATYLGIGTASGKRGVYHSHSVYGEAKDVPLGVVVIKASIELIEKELSLDDDESILVTDSWGVVFISSRKDWLYHSLRKLSHEEISQIAASLQFGEGPWNWTGLEIKGDKYAADGSGNEYLIHQTALDNYPGWNIIHLQNFRTISKRVSEPLVRITGEIVLILCFFVGMSVFILYRKASHEIIRRKEIENALRKSKERYRTIYHNTPAMLHSINNKGQLVNVSDHWLEVLGYEPGEVIGQQLTRFLTEDSRQYAMDIVAHEFFKTGFCRDVAYQFVKKSGETIDVLLSAFGERDEAGQVIRSLAVSIDVTERKRDEEALKLAKEELSRYSKDLERQVRKRTEEIMSILKYTPDVVYIKDREGRYLLVNSQYESLFGVKNEEIRGKTDYEIHSEELADLLRSSDLQVVSEGRSCQVEEQIPQDDGIHTYLSVKFPIYDESDTASGVGGISTDITQVKKTQDQLRRLSGSIMASHEKERAAIARELHDELGQVLTALRMDSVWILKRLNETDPKAAERVLTMCSLIDKTIEDVRGIAIRLRPGVLDDLGLVDALEWFAADFERRTEITCVFEHTDVPMVIEDMIATAAYRIAQESLTNVMRHASASRADVVLKAQDSALILTVTDNGRGFDTSALAEVKGLGVAGMRERASLVGGILEVESMTGEGTRVCFRLKIDV